MLGLKFRIIEDGVILKETIPNEINLRVDINYPSNLDIFTKLYAMHKKEYPNAEIYFIVEQILWCTTKPTESFSVEDIISLIRDMDKIMKEGILN